MNPFKAGDKVRALEGEEDITAGKVYVVHPDQNNSREGTLAITDDVGEENALLLVSDFELVTPVETYIINGSSKKFSSQAEAEAYAANMNHDGAFIEIAKLVRSCRVKKETISTLEDVA